MGSLTGNQIQNSYQGLIKTENNGAAGGTDVKLTDGVGNDIGIELNPTGSYNSVAKFTNQYDTFKRGSIDLQNVNFNINNSPMAPFSTFSGVGFTDVNNTLTGSISQNRFGGITLGNNIPAQPYIFTDFAGTARVDINGFGNVNNSDNWLTGYNQSVNGLSFDSGTRDLTLGRNNDSDLVVNIPGGGGGGSQVVRSLSSVRPIGQAGFGNIETTYKMTHMTTGYGTQNYVISSDTEFMAIPFTEVEGYTIDDIAFQVGTGVAGATTNIHLYKATAKTVNLFGGGTQEVLDGTFVADLATNIDCSTSGMKFIGGIGQVLPAAADNLYFFLYRMANGNGVNMTQYSNAQVINPNNSVYMAGTTSYRFVTWQSGGNTSAPTDLDLQSMSASTGSGLIRTLYSTKA